MLKSNNGIMNTLATNGDKKFDFTVQNDGEDVTLKTRAPAPEEAADAPKSSKHKKPSADDAPSDSPADSPDGDAADQTADDNASVRLDGGRLVAMVLSLCLGLLLL
ncbi:hypothetical protein NC653_004785 [Populus alba x Populus x berolinensis]|uniref:Uncharacterized protein n=1 Tax=Populus alba x Populus x berolinensis TaxID=444605 RepID=A0AAD6WKC7_9ROSI|nr:hypothetical protein NC653_004785 [Populus alba x Populus x berolinensis]